MNHGVVDIELRTTRSRKLFKRLVGRTNHSLITVLVGLDGVRRGLVDKQESFRTSWNTNDFVQSAEQARVFTVRATLAWVVDSLDAYLRDVDREPRVVSESLGQKLRGAGDSVGRRFSIVRRELGIESTAADLVDLSLAWRNRLVHYFARNDIMPDCRERLVREADQIEMDYSGLLIRRCLDSFDAGANPSFKETASLVAATHAVVKNLDTLFLERIDVEKYALQILAQHVKANPNRWVTVWTGDPDRSTRAIRQILIQNGFSRARPDATVGIRSRDLDRWGALGQSKAKQLLDKN